MELLLAWLCSRDTFRISIRDTNPCWPKHARDLYQKLSNIAKRFCVNDTLTNHLTPQMSSLSQQLRNETWMKKGDLLESSPLLEAQLQAATRFGSMIDTNRKPNMYVLSVQSIFCREHQYNGV